MMYAKHSLTATDIARVQVQGALFGYLISIIRILIIFCIIFYELAKTWFWQK